MNTFYEMAGFAKYPKHATIIGEAPSKNSDWRYPMVGGHTGKKVERLLGVGFRSYLKHYRRFDLLKFYPGTKWPREVAAANAVAIIQLHAPGSHLVLLGRKVFEAFGLDDHSFCNRVESKGMAFWLSPHPSGLNRWWQDPENKKQGLEFWLNISKARPRDFPLH